MRLDINAGGLSGFFNGVSSFIKNAVNNNASNGLINSFQTVINRTNNVSGGVGTLGTALGYIQTRKTAEETRKSAIQAVQIKTDSFIQIAISVDKQVANSVNQSKESFYRTNEWARPVSGWDRFWNDPLGTMWNGIKDFYLKHKKVIDTALIVVGAVLAIAAVVCTGGMALAPLLVGLGASAAWATGISLTVAGIAVLSTVGASTLNIIDTWAEIDNPAFNTWQSIFNWTSGISNGLYSIGSIYNSVKGVSAAELKTFRSQKFTTQQIKDAVKQDSIIKHTMKSIAKSGGDDVLTKAQKGNLGEMLTDRQMRIDGYKRISLNTVTDLNKSFGKGIDGIYSNGSKYIIGEAKYTNSIKPTSSLLGSSKAGKQMSDSWIKANLNRAVGRNAAKDILKIGYDKTLFRIQGGIIPKITSEVLK